MSKAKHGVAAVVEKKSKKEMVTDAVKKIGKKASPDEVMAILEAAYPGEEFSESTIKQETSKANVALGYSEGRGSKSGGKSASGEVLLTDLMAAKQLLAELKLSPEKLIELVEKLSIVGDLEKLKKCLAALEELAG